MQQMCHGLREQGRDSACIIPFCWIKQNGDSAQLCNCSCMCFIAALGLHEEKRQGIVVYSHTLNCWCSNNVQIIRSVALIKLCIIFCIFILKGVFLWGFCLHSDLGLDKGTNPFGEKMQ